MRILFWSESFWPSIGGVQVFAARLLPALRARGYEFVVITQRASSALPDQEQFKGIPVYRFPLCAAFWEGNIEQLTIARQQVAKLKRSFAPALVHVNSFGPSVLFQLDTIGAHPAPFLITLHTLPRDEFKLAMGRDALFNRTLRSATRVTCVSSAVLKQAQQLVPEITPCSSVIYNGLDVPPLLPAPLPIDPPRLLCLGRLSPEKGFDVALRTFATVVARFPQARLIIAGDGPARADLQQQATALGLTEAVEFLGWVNPDQVPALINTTTIVVMPSRREGLPLAALEAAFMARPVVATRAGGLPEVVAHGQTGLLVEQDDSERLAEAITFLLRDLQAATQMGQAARQQAVEVFSFERCVDAYDALYQKLIKA